jgi:hypothetical protein
MWFLLLLTWRVINADATTAIEMGKPVVHLRPHGDPNVGSHIGIALVEGAVFTEGVLEVDLKGLGKSEASFLGLAFGVADENHFEAIYFRPFRFASDDVAARGHAVQYVAWPEHTWEKLRKDKPGVYEAAIKPVPDPSGWFHARIVVTKQKVSVWVDDAKQPCLIVDRLGGRARGKVGLWVDSKEGAFRNLKIVNAS